MLLEFGFALYVAQTEFLDALVADEYPFDARSESQTVFEFECVVRIDIDAVGIGSVLLFD